MSKQYEELKIVWSLPYLHSGKSCDSLKLFLLLFPHFCQLYKFKGAFTHVFWISIILHIIKHLSYLTTHFLHQAKWTLTSFLRWQISEEKFGLTSSFHAHKINFRTTISESRGINWIVEAKLKLNNCCFEAQLQAKYSAQKIHVKVRSG